MFMSRKALDAVALLLACIPLSLYSSLVTYSVLHMLNVLLRIYFFFSFFPLEGSRKQKAAVFVGAADHRFPWNYIAFFFSRAIMAARYHPYERTAKGAPFQATHPQQIAGHHMPHMTPNHHVVPNRMAPQLMPQQQFIPQVFPIPLAMPAKHVCARETNILQRGSARFCRWRRHHHD